MVLSLPLDDVSSIHFVQKEFSENISHKSVAQELIQNSLNEKQSGSIHILRNLILLIIDSKEENVNKLAEKVNSGLEYAKKCYISREERMKSLEGSQKNLKSHGRGFLLMFYLGWDIITLPGKDKLLIAAIRA
jgi:hypothetical protein